MSIEEFLEEYEGYDYNLNDLIKFINRDLDTEKKVNLKIVFTSGKWDIATIKNPFAFEEIIVTVKEKKAIGSYGLYEFKSIQTR